MDNAHIEIETSILVVNLAFGQMAGTPCQPSLDGISSCVT